MKRILTLLVVAILGVTALMANDIDPNKGIDGPRPCQGINGKWGYQNVSGVMVIRAKYDDARPFYQGLAAVCRDGRWGFINVQGRTVVKCRYQIVENFKNGYAAVKCNGKWGAVNLKGEEEVPCQFDTREELYNLTVTTRYGEKSYSSGKH